MTAWQAYIDGASKGNPGEAGIGVILIDSDGVVETFSKAIGKATNNEAEYTALLACLDHARDRGVRRLRIHSDSQLMVCQINGQYAVRNEGLRRLYREAQKRFCAFGRVELVYVPRSQNADADALASSAARKPQKNRL